MSARPTGRIFPSSRSTFQIPGLQEQPVDPARETYQGIGVDGRMDRL